MNSPVSGLGQAKAIDARLLQGQQNAPTARESQTQGQFTRLAEGTKYLHDRIGLIHQRLEGLLRTEPCSPDNRKQEGRSLVRHAEGLANFADMIDGANAALDDLLTRLEF